MNLLKAYFNYMENPELGLHTLMQRRSFRQACLGYFMATLSWVIFFNVGDGLSIPALVLKLFFVFIAEITAGYCLASFAGLFLDLKKTPVSCAELFVLIGSAGWIKGLLIAGALISAMCPTAQLWLLAPLFLAGVLLLQLGYLTRGLMRISTLSVARALGTWIIAFIPVCVLFGLISVFGVWAIILLVS